MNVIQNLHLSNQLAALEYSRTAADKHRVSCKNKCNEKEKGIAFAEGSQVQGPALCAVCALVLTLVCW